MIWGPQGSERAGHAHSTGRALHEEPLRREPLGMPEKRGPVHPEQGRGGSRQGGETRPQEPCGVQQDPAAAAHSEPDWHHVTHL